MVREFFSVRPTKTRDQDLHDGHGPADGERRVAPRSRRELHTHGPDGAVQADARLRGLLPIGWDDNGLPTERRVQNYFGVRCDPAALRPGPRCDGAGAPEHDPVPVSRGNFIELCERLTAEDEKSFEDLFRRVGLGSTGPTCTRDRERPGGSRRSGSWRMFWAGLLTRPRRLRCGTSTPKRRGAGQDWRDREIDRLAAGSRRPRGRGPARPRSRHSRPELIPARRARPRTPATSGMHHSGGVTPLVPCRSWRTTADPREGTGIAMVYSVRRCGG